MKVIYSVDCQTYYDHNGVFSHTLYADTFKDLQQQVKDYLTVAKNDPSIEAVRFSQVVTKKYTYGQKFKTRRFRRKITNKYY